MSRAIDRRVKALEEQIEPRQVHRVIRFHHPDGTVTYLAGEEPAPGEDCDFINILSSEVIEGRPATDDELEAMYPGRRERIAQRELKGGQ
ncbi:hypothetical protein [Geothrix edaphica]|uniref:Uncharacterized protein n=1 Tax=Geothrix edaphica TaxID=2927976 RepID=A0ABQ5PY64_9BACT|nr:hypothetical protein [Geothrix edaphica]GLH67314.1 hypothetical protein GETHED_16780 [Geothrix edaphica]